MLLYAMLRCNAVNYDSKLKERRMFFKTIKSFAVQFRNKYYTYK